jgi:ketosteroid isomerase-like protein
VSENLDLVRSLYTAWERGDFGSTEWADPEIEYVVVGGPTPGCWTGVAGLHEAFRDFVSAWVEFGLRAVECRELDDERVLVFTRLSGRGRTSGLDLAQMQGGGADVLHIRNGKVAKFVLYHDRDRALADLGLED